MKWGILNWFLVSVNYAFDLKIHIGLKSWINTSLFYVLRQFIVKEWLNIVKDLLCIWIHVFNDSKNLSKIIESHIDLLYEIYMKGWIKHSFYIVASIKRKENFNGHWSRLSGSRSLIKGQLNSEWIYEVIVSPKMPTKNYQDFCPTL